MYRITLVRILHEGNEVQVQTVFFKYQKFSPKYLNLLIKVISSHRLRAICGLVRLNPKKYIIKPVTPPAQLPGFVGMK